MQSTTQRWALQHTHISISLYLHSLLLLSPPLPPAAICGSDHAYQGASHHCPGLQLWEDGVYWSQEVGWEGPSCCYGDHPSPQRGAVETSCQEVCPYYSEAGVPCKSVAAQATPPWCPLCCPLLQARFLEFKIQNMVGSCDVKFPIRLEGLVINQPQFSRQATTC